MSSKEKYKVPALERALDIIEYLASEKEARSLSVISEDVNRNPSEIFRILDCLVRRNYVSKDRLSNTYSLSLKLYSVTNNTPFIKRLTDASIGPMSQLTKQIGESCHLSVLEGSDLVVLYEQEGIFPVHIHAKIGARIPVSMTSSGKVLLSLMPIERQQATIEMDQNFQEESEEFKTDFLNQIYRINSEKVHIIKPEKETDLGLDIVSSIRLHSDFYAALAVSLLDLHSHQKRRVNEEFLKAMVEEAAISVEEKLGTNA